MLTKESLCQYQYSLHEIDKNSIIVAPHELLRPYIANYTFTNPSNMPEQQTVLPTISSTLVCATGNGGIINGLRGVNTKPTMIADYARQFDFMFLVEFHAAGLYPFIGIDQGHLTDNGFSLEALSSSLNQQITEAYYTSNDIHTLTNKLDSIFLSRITDVEINSTFLYAFKKVLENKGNIRVKELAKDVYYSEKQLNRLFMKYAGANVKMCSRIVRMKNAVDLLSTITDTGHLFELTGHYDYAHFIHDFTDIYEFTPKEYLSKMSLFYNDPFKL